MAVWLSMKLMALRNVIEPDLSSYDPAYEIDNSLLENCKPHHREAIRLAMTDLYGKRMEALIRLPSSWERVIIEKWLNDPRDLELFLTFLQTGLWLSFSSAVQLCVLPADSGWSYLWLVPHMLVTWLFMGQRFILAMHYAAHRPLFNERRHGRLGKVLNLLPQTLLSNFYGMPAGSYYLHHIVMHHSANNCFPYDISSTMPYQRDSPLHFVAYVMNFVLHTLCYLPFYAISKRRWNLAGYYFMVVSLYLTSFPMIYAYNPLFFNMSLGIPFILGPFALMLGNYSQHIFVDPDDSDSNYCLACNHINAPFNMATFNDGYHITHHISEHLHWRDMPKHFIKNIEQYEAGGAIIFKGIPFEEITFAAFAGEKGLRRLAKQVVQITEKHKTEDELVALFRRRLQPIGVEQTKLHVGQKAQLGVHLGNQCFWVFLWMVGFPLASIPSMCVPLFHLIYHFG